jgi:BsuBI/PstI restriction endonuclease domain/BsuBI/PstI restriction endonuclease HTH domain
MNAKERRLNETLVLLVALGLPRAQQNERTCVTLLALLDLPPGKRWKNAVSPLMGITPIMDWARTHYGSVYAPNTRETFRRQTMHQLVDAGIALYNPDNPLRPVNSPKAVYRIAPAALELLQAQGSATWPLALASFLASKPTLVAQYAAAREQRQISVTLSNGETVKLTPGEHSVLIKAIIEDFAPRFAPGSVLVYAGDTGAKWVCFDKQHLSSLGVSVDSHGKMPDVVLHDISKNWLLLVESVTSHGPVNGKRHAELAKLFKRAHAGLVYVTAFPNRKVMAKYLNDMAWETEVWLADAPSHMIHFNGDRYLGPHVE